MSKRKRSEDDETSSATASKDFRHQRQIVATFTQSAKELLRAFKNARGFERQKLGRRKKDAVKEGQNTDRIDEEVKALKALDLTTCAAHFLAKSLVKIKRVAEHADLPLEVRKSAEGLGRKDPASLNVFARLCNSNPVKTRFGVLCAAVKREFGVDDGGEVGPVKKKRLRAKDFDGNRGDEADVERRREKKQVNGGAVESDSFEGFGDSDDASEDGMAQYRARLASSDEEDEEEGDVEMGSDSDIDVDDLERQLAAEGISAKGAKVQSKPYDHAADLSLSEASQAESEDEGPQMAPAPKKSSFIPSLTMGGYISGSGSEVEDEIDDKPKKNRRGQRARRQIAEWKYGLKAKHLQNQKKNDSNIGWDPKRGAVDRDHRRQKKTGANDTALGRDRREAAKQPKNKHEDDKRPLHPSWEAAKKAKEKKSVPIAFAGKKISFD
ncbi:Hypothetical predicted protein [Lecanosticta acicola]|uniref:Bud22 domain-containing protein n=1 Tax=Lecanosticta acicola TaxID=111012 RepID=A0AAI8YY07_9PEZI|nr:Hypothetical predicted protein [Lecanosticta acicola]